MRCDLRGPRARRWFSSLQGGEADVHLVQQAKSRRERAMKIGRLLARLAIGGLFIGHGTQKWFGWFGGPGLEKTTGMMEKLGMSPPRRNAHAVSASETLGGAL